MITILTNLSTEILVAYYNQAYALLIPLRDNDQDRARFPHKISEYLATGNPIITTPVGEIPLYFENGKNAFIARDTLLESFTEQMSLVLQDSQRARKIGLEGKVLGQSTFDHRIYSEPLRNFLER